MAPSEMTIGKDKWVVIRSNDSGGWLAKVEEWVTHDAAVLVGARRIWSWEGAATLSELATEGCSKSSKMPAPVDRVYVTGICEAIEATDRAVARIAEVPLWSAHAN